MFFHKVFTFINCDYSYERLYYHHYKTVALHSFSESYQNLGSANWNNNTNNATKDQKNIITIKHFSGVITLSCIMTWAHRCFDVMYMYANDGFSSFCFKLLILF